MNDDMKTERELDDMDTQLSAFMSIASTQLSELGSALISIGSKFEEIDDDKRIVVSEAAQRVKKLCERLDTFTENFDGLDLLLIDLLGLKLALFGLASFGGHYDKGDIVGAIEITRQCQKRMKSCLETWQEAPYDRTH
jgi:hypothetical protein